MAEGGEVAVRFGEGWRIGLNQIEGRGAAGAVAGGLFHNECGLVWAYHVLWDIIATSKRRSRLRFLGSIEGFAMRRKIIVRGDWRCGGGFIGELLEPRRLLSGYTLHVLSTFSQPEGSTGQIVEDQNGDLFFMHATATPSAPSAVWELAKGSSTATQLAQFDPTVDGGVSGIDIDSAGDLFGTGTGSASNDGVIWEIAAGTNSITTFATFSRQLNGSGPTGNLVFDSSGDMFGRTGLGGADQEGIVWEIAHGSSTITVLAPIPPSVNPGEASVTVGGLAIDSNGNLYGTASPETNSAGDGSIWELPAGGSAITIVASFDGTDGSSPASGLFVDSSGDIFGEAQSGGASFGNANALSGQGYGSIFEIAAGSSTITTLASFNGTDGEVPNGGLVADANGNLFGVAMTGVFTDSMLFELPKGDSATTTLQTFNDSTGIVYGTSPFVDASGDVIDATDIGVFELAPGGGGGSGGGGSGSLTGTLSGKLASTVIAGQKVNINQHLTITNDGSGIVSGDVSAELFLSTSTSADSGSIPLTSAGKTVKLKPKAKLSFNFKVAAISTAVPDTTYYLVAQITDPSSNISDAASSSTVVVIAPTIDLSGVFAKQPVPGKTGKTALTFTVSNAGNIAAVGPLAFNIETSPDGLLDDATTLSTPSKKINIKAGKSTKVMTSIALPAGSYFLVIQLDPNDVFSDVDLGNNIFATLSSLAVL